jgi:hypothetical protein
MPKKPLQISPFDILYGKPLLIPGLLPSPPATLSPPLLKLLLSHLRASLWGHSDSHLPQPIPSTETPSSIKIDDLVYLSKPHSSTSLKPKWMGSYKIILATPTAAKLKGYSAWVHISRLKLYLPHSYRSILMGPTSLKISQLLSIPEHKETPN